MPTYFVLTLFDKIPNIKSNQSDIGYICMSKKLEQFMIFNTQSNWITKCFLKYYTMYIDNHKAIWIAKCIRSLVVCAMIKFKFYFEKA